MAFFLRISSFSFLIDNAKVSVDHSNFSMRTRIGLRDPGQDFEAKILKPEEESTFVHLGSQF